MIDYTKPIDFTLAGSRRAPVSRMILIVALPLAAFVCMTIVAARSGWTDPQSAKIAIVVAASLCLLTAALLRLACSVRVRVEDDRLIVRTSLGRKCVPLLHFRGCGVRVVNLKTEPELAPQRRLWAASLPGLRSGWFYLRNREKAVCVLSDRTHVTYLRSDVDRLSMLLSLQNPELLCALIARAE
ncbi:MAG: hypothetical protein ABJB01_11040 [Rudaea sp.]